MGFDLLNELQYNFGTKGARAGELQKDPSTNKIEANLFQRALGLTSADLQAHDLEGRFDRFKDTDPQASDARRYGVSINKSDLNNLGGLEDRIEAAKDLRTAKSTLKGLGNTTDLSGFTDAASLAPLIQEEKTKNLIETTGAVEKAKYESPGSIRQRDVEDRRWNETQRLNLLDRADAREAKASELEYMRMRDRKDDRRYNESIERMDRKDRKQSIQTLVAGLANLGAAFAI